MLKKYILTLNIGLVKYVVENFLLIGIKGTLTISVVVVFRPAIVMSGTNLLDGIKAINAIFVAIINVRMH